MIFISFIYFISETYALRFFYYEFIFFMIMISLIPNLKVLNYEKLKNYFVIFFISASLSFSAIWYKYANENLNYKNYKVYSDIKIFCKKKESCNNTGLYTMNLFDAVTNSYILHKKHLQIFSD